MMVMLGGAWVPTFIFPAWLQQFTLVVPVRWAVDGLDAMTWRGIGLSGALVPVAVLFAFALPHSATIAAARFKWEEALGGKTGTGPAQLPSEVVACRTLSKTSVTRSVFC